MAGKTAGAAITRYAGIQVQTSSLGLQIPVGWGTFRCSCNLVDYLDFKSSKQQAGKGGQTVGYSYSATIIMAICEGPIDAITSVYVDGKIYAYNSSGNANTGSNPAMTQAGLSWASGAVGQAVWSYLTSNHPTHAIGYSGLAIAYAENYALDSSASPPNHSFEVVRTSAFGVAGSPDADPSLMVTDFFQNTRTGVPSWQAGLLGNLPQFQAYCLASGLLLSPVIDSERTGTDFLEEVLLATNTTCVWSEGLLKFIPYGDTQLSGNGATYTPNNTPVYSLNDDDYIPKTDGDPPILVDLMDQSDAYNAVQMEYLDRTNQYNMAIALASDAANIAQYGRRLKDPDTIHVVCTPAVAQIAGQLWLQRTLYIRAQYKFTLGWMFALLEPGDILELNDSGLGLVNYPVRIIQIDEGEDGNYDLTCEDFPIGVANAPVYAMQTSANTGVNAAIDPGSVEANLLSWSEDLTQSAWTKNNVSITANAIADPLFGTTTADKIVPSTSTGQPYAAQTIPAGATFSGANYTFSVYLSRDGYNNVQVGIGDGSGNYVYVNVDMLNGLVHSSGQAGTATYINSVLTNMAGSWCRVSITGVFTSPPLLRFFVNPLSSTWATSFAGDGTSAIFMWGAQAKVGVDTPAYCYSGNGIVGPAVFNAPAALVNGVQNEIWAAAAGGVNWGGCNVWVSVDGTSYEQVGQITEPARYGRLMNATTSTADPDTTDSFQLDLGASAGTLTSASTGTADSAGTLSLLGSELVSFSTATLTGQNRYTLQSYTRRGQLGTTAAAHSLGDAFVRLDDAIFQFPYLNAAAGQTIYVKFQSFNLWGNAEQNLADCIAYEATPTSQALAQEIAVGVNRVILSQFEKGLTDGWSTGFGGNTFGSVTSSLATTDGLPTRTASATVTGSGGFFNQASQKFPVNGGEQIYISAEVGSSGPCTGSLAVVFYDQNGTQLPGVGPTWTGSKTFPALVGGFATTPTNAVTALLAPTLFPTGAGTISLSFARPMVAGAFTGQTTAPAWNAGPLSEPGADVTFNWTAASIQNISPLAQGNSLTTAQVTNTGVPAGSQNRVAFTLFEKPYPPSGATSTTHPEAWTINYNPQAVTPTFTVAQVSGDTVLQIGGLNASGAGNGLTIGGDSVNYPFAVTPGEYVYVSCLTGGSNASVAVVLEVFDSSGNEQNVFVTGGLSSPAFPAQQWAVVQIPTLMANGNPPKTAVLSVFGQSLASGTWSFEFGQPFVCGVQQGQTSFPAFTAGPSNVPAADVTADNTAGGFANSGTLAYLNNVGSGEILPGVLLGSMIRLNMVANPSGVLTAAPGVSPIQATADFVPLFDQYGHMIVLQGMNLSMYVTTQIGAGSCDSSATVTAAVAGAWLYVYVISNGTTSSLIVSTSTTAPTLPSGYTYYQRLGAVRVYQAPYLLFSTYYAAALYPTIQLGQHAQYINLNTGSLPVIAASGNAGNGTSWVALQVNGVTVPETATHFKGALNTQGGHVCYAAPNSSYSTSGGPTSPPYVSATWNNVTSNLTILFEMLIEPATGGYIYWTSNYGSGTVMCNGWTDNIAA